jgi:GntR family transcriptional regulator
MNVRVPVRGKSLSAQTEEILIERIKNGVYPPGSQIPPENRLAEEFEVSRSTIRTAISTLAAQGLLVRRHGLGTFVSQRSNLSNPLNEAIDFNHLIANNGFAPAVRYVQTQLVTPKPEIATALNIEPGQPALQEYKVFSADDEPVIYCINILPAHWFDEALLQEIVDTPQITEPLYDFLEQRAQQQINFFIAKVRAEIARNCVFPELSLDPTVPVLTIEEVAYSAEETPLCYTLEYFPSNSGMSFELTRRRVRKQR